ncbi:MAG: DMT family transporter [Planctomycetes bacterium]|nr:DMT family transporter [Planctomycetota bacterium]
MHDVAALACALSFAVCSLAFGAAGRVVGAQMVNRLRLVMAVALLTAVHAWCFGEVWPAAAGRAQISLLVLSGVVGLALGDGCYFHALSVLGPRLGTLLMATAPVFAVLADGCLRGVWPGAREAAGMAMVSGGVLLVLSRSRRGAAAWRPDAVSSRQLALAVLAGLGGAVGQGLGLVLAKLATSAPHAALPPLTMAHLRMLAGLLGVAVIWVCTPRTTAGRRKPMTGRAFAWLSVGVAFGPTLGVWLSMVAVSGSGDPGRSSVLIATTPILMVGIAWGCYGDRPEARGVTGTLLAVAGAAVLLL